MKTKGARSGGRTISFEPAAGETLTRGNMDQGITVWNITKGLSIEQQKFGVGWRLSSPNGRAKTEQVSTFHRYLAISGNFT